MSFSRPVDNLRGGPSARAQLLLLRALTLAAIPFGQRGVHRAAWTLARVFDRANSVTVDLGFGHARVPLADGYAVKLLAPGYRYEPEIEPIVRGAMQRGCAFIDGGANLGYWSLLASSCGAGSGDVVAVEPMPSLFDLLTDNAALNDHRFMCRNAALWSESGATVTMVSHRQRHAGSSAVNLRDRALKDGYDTVEVPTTTVDDLVQQHWPGDRPILLKLDVEGAEIHALQGAADTLAHREVVLVYEDHGDDADHRSTRHVANELGFRVYKCGPRPQEIFDVADVARYKTDTVHGFNFVAFPPGSTIGEALVAGGG